MSSPRYTVAAREGRLEKETRTTNNLAAAEIIAADLARRYPFVDIYRLRGIESGVSVYDIVKTMKGAI